jgi:hypothetical protein
MLQCSAKNVNPLELLCPHCRLPPSFLNCLPPLCSPQVLLNAPTGAGNRPGCRCRFLEHGGINGAHYPAGAARLAARNVAQRLAELLNEKPGETVGYRMRAKPASGRRPGWKW